MDGLKITVSWPAKELSPNWRGHWAAKAKAKKAARIKSCFFACRSMRACFGSGDDWEIRYPHWKHATAVCVCYAKANRRRDRDNMLASLKATFDGLVDAGVLEDDAGLIHLPLEFKLDRDNPRVEITIKPVKGKSL